MIRTMCIFVSMALMAGTFGVQPTMAQDQNEADLGSGEIVDGAIGTDTIGIVRTLRDDSLSPESNPFFAVDENGVPTQFDLFQLFQGAYLDAEVVANEDDFITGILMLDKFGGVHTRTFQTLGVEPSPENPLTAADNGPRIDYLSQLANHNTANPGNQVFFPYFPFDVDVPTASNGAARDIEVAVDWRSVTNAFQGYYILDAFAGIHYVNNPTALGVLSANPNLSSDGVYTEGMNKFRDIFGFRTQYLVDYAGKDEQGNVQSKPAPYFGFTGDSGFPIARDIDVIPTSKDLTQDLVNDSHSRSALAASEGVNLASMFQPIEIPATRLNPSNEVFAPNVAITQGYAIMDGFGAIHAMVEDEDGNPMPAPWEDEESGINTDAPYFLPFDLAIDIEVMPNGGGVVLLNRVGEVFVINAQGLTSDDNFVEPGIEDDLPSFGFDSARDLTLVSNDEGKIVGIYVLDRFGTVHRAGDVPRLRGNTLYFLNGQSRNLEVSPIARPVTSAQ